MIDRASDEFELFITEEEQLDNEVKIMEDASTFVPGITTKNLRLEGIPSPIEASEFARTHGLDAALTYDTVCEGTTGTKLVVSTPAGKCWNVSGIARGTLYNAAKLNGPALGRMDQAALAMVLNAGLNVANGYSMLLERHGKIMSFHGDGSNGYAIMPISELLEVARRELTKKFGTIVFKSGYTSNFLTEAVWELPDVQSDICDKYQQALASAATNLHAINFMPCVRFTSSDTSDSAAKLCPMLMLGNGAMMSLGSPVAVKHVRSGEIFGVELFEQRAGEVFAKLDETVERMRLMGECELFNPVNACVGFINAVNKTNVIRRKYADTAREEIETALIMNPIMSVHDVYLFITETIMGLAEANHEPMQQQLKMSEALSRIVSLNWKDFDIGGTVAWSAGN